MNMAMWWIRRRNRAQQQQVIELRLMLERQLQVQQQALAVQAVQNAIGLIVEEVAEQVAEEIAEEAAAAAQHAAELVAEVAAEVAALAIGEGGQEEDMDDVEDVEEGNEDVTQEADQAEPMAIAGPSQEMSCSVSERVPENRSGTGGSGCRLRGSSSTSLATPPNARGGQQSGGLRPKPCCLCWCCCCSCCSTPGKGEDGPSKNSNSDLLNREEIPPPTLEEIRGWGRSFDRLMRSYGGRQVFRDFLRCEYSEENILFWLACEDLKLETSPEAVEEKARIIYEDYISILSPKEVSLDSRVREIVNRNMVEPTPHTFDEAQVQIYTLMHRDSYPRFVNSSIYKALAGNDSESPVQAETDNLQG